MHYFKSYLNSNINTFYNLKQIPNHSIQTWTCSFAHSGILSSPAWGHIPRLAINIVLVNEIHTVRWQCRKSTFLSKIQSHIFPKIRMKIILLIFKKLYFDNFLNCILEFPSIYLIQFSKVHSRFLSNFLIQFFKEVEFPSDFEFLSG